jgi:hypothetical protein
MTDIKIKTHTISTYETTDGRTFDDRFEATEWQLALEELKHIPMLDDNLKPTTVPEAVYCVCLKTYPQLRAFVLWQDYHGVWANQIKELGYWYYDDNKHSYINLIAERDKLINIIDTLTAFGK